MWVPVWQYKRRLRLNMPSFGPIVTPLSYPSSLLLPFLELMFSSHKQISINACCSVLSWVTRYLDAQYARVSVHCCLFTCWNRTGQRDKMQTMLLHNTTHEPSHKCQNLIRNNQAFADTGGVFYCNKFIGLYLNQGAMSVHSNLPIRLKCISVVW